jgi:hypothetical protein
VHQALSACRTRGLALSRRISSASQLPVQLIYEIRIVARTKSTLQRGQMKGALEACDRAISV